MNLGGELTGEQLDLYIYQYLQPYCDTFMSSLNSAGQHTPTGTPSSHLFSAGQVQVRAGREGKPRRDDALNQRA